MTWLVVFLILGAVVGAGFYWLGYFDGHRDGRRSRSRL